MAAAMPSPEIDVELDRLAAMLPRWLASLRREALFWPQFDALCDEIRARAGAGGRQHVERRVRAMLRVHRLRR